MRRIAFPLALALVFCGITSGITTTAALAPTVTSQQQTVDDQSTELLAAVAPADARRKSRVILPIDGPNDQMITVSTTDRNATTAVVGAWTRANGTWRKDIGPVTAYVGSQGIGDAAEGVSRTPAGLFGLTEAFGIQDNNGTRLPYFKVDEQDWWVSDVDSPEYNKHFRCAVGSCPFNEGAGERLITAGTAYNHAVVINYNRDPVTAGAGSAFFLHVSSNRPTAGCVAVPADKLDEIMRWLDPAKKPAILIG